MSVGTYAIDFWGTIYDVAERMSLIDRLTELQMLFEGLIDVNNASQSIARLDAALLRGITVGK